MKNETIEFRTHRDFADLLDGQCIVTVGIRPSREAILLAVDLENQAVPFGREERPG